MAVTTGISIRLCLAGVALAVFACASALPAARAQMCAGIEVQPATLPGAQSFTYRTASGRDLRLHVFAPKGEGMHSAVLFFFGGGWMIGKVEQFQAQAEAAEAAGIVSVLADYRVSCRDKTSPVDALSDAEAAYAWLRGNAAGLGIAPGRIVLAGGSAGGQLAAAAAILAPVGETPAGLVLFNPALDMVSFGGRIGLSPDQAAAISPSVLPVANLPPTIIFHGDADTIVPIQISRDFCRRAAAGGRACELDEYPGQNHGFFNSRAADPKTHVSPYDDTLAKTLGFLTRVFASSTR